MKDNPLSVVVRRHLQKVDRLVAVHLRTDDPLLRRLGEHLVGSNGKRVRPTLVILTARHLGRLNSTSLTLAATVELLHAATLVHDDILDNAHLRRHQKTLNFRWGNEMSVLMGDYVFAATLRLMMKDLSREVLRSIADTAATVCQGQILETHHRYDPALTEEEYLRIIGDKTASLLSVCCSASAMVCGAPYKTAGVFGSFGRLLGLAFQVIDDTLDYSGRTSRFGKPVLSDLKEGRVTLPFLHCYRRSTRKERKILAAAVESARKGRFQPAPVLELLKQHGSVEYSRMRAWDYVAEAQSLLARARKGRGSLGELMTYSEYLVRRDH